MSLSGFANSFPDQAIWWWFNRCESSRVILARHEIFRRQLFPAQSRQNLRSQSLADPVRLPGSGVLQILFHPGLLPQMTAEESRQEMTVGIIRMPDGKHYISFGSPTRRPIGHSFFHTIIFSFNHSLKQIIRCNHI